MVCKTLWVWQNGPTHLLHGPVVAVINLDSNILLFLVIVIFLLSLEGAPIISHCPAQCDLLNCRFFNRMV